MNRIKTITFQKRALREISIHLENQEERKNLLLHIKNIPAKPDPDARLMQKFNTKGDTLLTITEGKWFTGDDPEIDKVEWSTGMHSFSKNGFPSIN